MAPSIPRVRDFLLAAMALPITAQAALSVTGSITLFSDTKCQEPVYVNDAVVGRDFCARTESAQEYLGAYGSFILNERPWCNDGSVPWWNVFNDDLCAIPAGSFEPGSDADGTCVSIWQGFKSYSFVCENVNLVSESDSTSDGYDVESTTSVDVASTTLLPETEPTLQGSTSISSASETSTIKSSSETISSTAIPPPQSSAVTSSARTSSQSTAPTPSAPVSTPEPTGGVGSLSPKQSVVLGLITIVSGSFVLLL